MTDVAPAVPHLGRLKWHSRRALLELDILLERFWQHHDDGDSLDPQQVQVLKELLELEDHDLWDMICGRQEIEDPRWKSFIASLIEVTQGPQGSAGGTGSR